MGAPPRSAGEFSHSGLLIRRASLYSSQCSQGQLPEVDLGYHWVCPSTPVWYIPAMGDTTRSTQSSSDDGDLSRNRQLACNRTPPDIPVSVERSAQSPQMSKACSSRNFCELSAGIVCSDVPGAAVFRLATAQNHSYSRRNQFAGYVKGMHCCSPIRMPASPPLRLRISGLP